MVDVTLAACFWAASTWSARTSERGSREHEAYSSTGLISSIYAVALKSVDWGGIVSFMNTREDDDLPVMESVFLRHLECILNFHFKILDGFHYRDSILLQHF